VVLSGALLLLALTALAFGAVHPWAFRIAETIAFVLFLLWMTKVLFLVAAGHEELAFPAALSTLALPLSAAIGLMAFALVPLPPALLKAISSPTYHLYEKCLAGWPSGREYSRDYSNDRRTPSTGTPSTHSDTDNGMVSSRGSWRPLSIAPTLTKTSLLGGCAYIAYFLVVSFYPFSGGGQQATQRLIFGILLTGVLIACIGLLERGFWNGKLLWFFVPEDWGQPHPDVPRALGSFVDPDHFADYLGMVFPLALAGVMFPWPYNSTKYFEMRRLFCAAALIVLAAAIILSFSRSVWVALPLSVAAFFLMNRSVVECWWSGSELPVRNPSREIADEQPAFETIRRKRLSPWITYGLFAAGFLAIELTLVGASARLQIDQRLGEMPFSQRLAHDKDTLRLIGDFPLLGVGLGSWAEIFPHYQSPPRSDLLNDHAHNDYLELVAEIGLVGALAVFWLGWRTIKNIVSETARSRLTPWRAALLCSVLLVVFHELFDFSLHIPANAFLLTAILAIAIRITCDGKSQAFAADFSKRKIRASAGVGAFAALLLALAATMQEPARSGFHRIPRTFDEAIDQVRAYPSYAGGHFSLAALDKNGMTPGALRELEIATWLDPNNPWIRDRYAVGLLHFARERDAADQIRLSVMFSPVLNTHFYLARRPEGYLSSMQMSAVEGGFREAVRRGYPGALGQFAAYYALSDRYSDEARLYTEAARKEKYVDERAQLLVAAGEAYSKANSRNDAEAAFLKATQLMPSDERPYIDLLSVVYGPAKDMKAARSTVDSGIRNGVDPVVLYSALAEAAQAANRPEVAGKALTELVSYAPTTQNTVRLAEFYLASGEADRAVDAMRKGTLIDPYSAEAWVRLAAAEQAAYLYADADRDYLHALSLEPDNPEAKSRYAEFQKRIADNHASAIGHTGN